ncbi:MAG: 2-hydroxyacid dehydrogenase [Actinomycetota bacterium]|nr:2-hydroxyacid dehydrogenase [Actinomycetota bacterium]
MPLIGELRNEAKEADRLFVFLDGLEFIAGTEEWRGFLQPLLAFGSCHYYKNQLDENHLLLERVRDAHAIFLDWSNLDAGVLSACGKLEIVSYIGVGAANFVDIEEATRRGIAVTNTPDYGNRSVAEHALGLVLAVGRNIARGDRDLREGRWTSREREGVQVSGRSIGLLGMGAVGKEMARLCHAFGLEVYYYDPRRQPEVEDIATYTDMETLLSSCQIISIHVALNTETRNLVSREKLGLMREDAILVNTSRGETLDLRALTGILEEGRLWGVGLDNFPGEPNPDLGALARFDRVVMTPHIAFNTREAKNRMTAIAVDNVTAFYRGEPRNVMNPEVL